MASKDDADSDDGFDGGREKDEEDEDAPWTKTQMKDYLNECIRLDNEGTSAQVKSLPSTTKLYHGSSSHPASYPNFEMIATAHPSTVPEKELPKHTGFITTYGWLGSGIYCFRAPPSSLAQLKQKTIEEQGLLFEVVPEEECKLLDLTQKEHNRLTGAFLDTAKFMYNWCSIPEKEAEGYAQTMTEALHALFLVPANYTANDLMLFYTTWKEYPRFKGKMKIQPMSLFLYQTWDVHGVQSANTQSFGTVMWLWSVVKAKEGTPTATMRNRYNTSLV